MRSYSSQANHRILRKALWKKWGWKDTYSLAGSGLGGKVTGSNDVSVISTNSDSTLSSGHLWLKLWLDRGITAGMNPQA